MAETAALAKHACPACGADASWNPARQALVCAYCGTVSPAVLSETGAVVREHDLAQALRAVPEDRRGWERNRVSVKCQSCQAISLFEAGRVAQRCEFCGSPAIVPYEATRAPIVPESVLPFAVSETQVRDQVRVWYGRRWFAPNRLRRAALTDTLHGLYVPYWTFDASVTAQWEAEAGHYYYTTESYRDQNGRTQTRQVQHVRWEPASGDLQHVFDDELVPATRGLQPAMLTRIQPFPTSQLVPYDSAYVSGWVVEQYQIDLVAAATQAREQMEQQVRQMCAQAVPGDTHRNLQVHSQYSGETFKHVLVPVWVLSYTYGRTSYQVLVNGFTGQMAGDHPLSWIKIALAIILVLIVAYLVLSTQ